MKRSYIIVGVAAVVLLAGAWLAGSAISKKKTAGNQPTPTVQTPEVTPKQQQDPVATVAPTLPPLPADNKQAIDSEVQGIDQEIDSVEASLGSDAADTELGL